MDSIPSILAPSLQELDDAISHFCNAPFESIESYLKRFISILDKDPLERFLVSVLPKLDVQTWWDTHEWPEERGERVAMQIAVFRKISTQDGGIYQFLHKYGYSTEYNDFGGYAPVFASKLLQPLVRDIQRLIEESRPIPPILSEAMGNLPKSGDGILDNFLHDAYTQFRDPAPKSREEATKKLWYAWERLKSIGIEGDKKRSVEMLLQNASPDPKFYQLLDDEATNLTKIGNKFHIRHSETDQTPLTQPEQFDYLFHRLYALIHFLLINRQRAEDDA